MLPRFRRILTSWQLLFVAALSVRLTFVATMGDAGLTWDDERDHDMIAWNLAQTGNFESSAYRAAPILPAFLAVTYNIFGHSFTAARAAQALLGAVLVVMVFHTARLLFGRTTGLVAGWCTALYPQLIYLSGVFYAEHMFAVLLAASVLSLVRCNEKPTFMRSAVAGLSLGLAALCRPVSLVLAPVAAGYVFWSCRPGKRMQSVCILIGVTLVAILPWTVRNAVVFRHFIPVAAGQGIHLWLGNNDLSRGDSDDRHLSLGGATIKYRVGQLGGQRRAEVEAQLESLQAELENVDDASMDSRLNREALAWIRAHPTVFLRNCLNRMVTMHEAFSRTLSSNEATSRRNRAIASVTFYPILICGVLGAFLAWRRNRASWVLHATVAALTLVHVVLTACTRFRIPIDPYWIIFASVAVAGVLERIPRRQGGSGN